MVGGKRDGACTPVRHRDHAGFGVKAALAIFLLQPIGQRRLLLDSERVERLAMAFLRGKAEPGDQFAVQPVGGPVARLIGAVAPDRSDSEPAGALPSRLPGP